MITDRSRRRFFGPAAAAWAWPLLGRVAGAQSATLAVGSGGALKLGVASRALRAEIEAAGITIMGGGTITIPNDPAKIKKEFEYAKNAGFPRS